MTVKELIETECFKVLHGDKNLTRTISRPYCCDLLSLAMGSAPSGCAWVTVMGNVNTLAVAALADAACVILAQGISLDEYALKKAKEQDITVLQSTEPVFETALEIYRQLHG